MICWVLAMQMLQGVWKQHLRPRAVVGYDVKTFLPSPPHYVTRSPGVDYSEANEKKYGWSNSGRNVYHFIQDFERRTAFLQSSGVTKYGYWKLVCYNLYRKSRFLDVEVLLKVTDFRRRSNHEWSFIWNADGKQSKCKVSHMTPAPWRDQPRTHAHNHITRAGIRKPWTAVSALFPDLIIMAKPILAEAGFYNCLGKYRLCNANEEHQGWNSWYLPGLYGCAHAYRVMATPRGWCNVWHLALWAFSFADGNNSYVNSLLCLST